MWRGVKGLVYVKGPVSCLLFISALRMVHSSILAIVRSCGPEGLGLVAFLISVIKHLSKSNLTAGRDHSDLQFKEERIH